VERHSLVVRSPSVITDPLERSGNAQQSNDPDNVEGREASRSHLVNRAGCRVTLPDVMTLRRRPADSVRVVCVAALMTTTALLLAACGGQSAERPRDHVSSAMSHEQYQQAIDKIVSSDDTRAATRLFTDAGATSFEKAPCEERVRGLYERLSAIVHEVEVLRPPADARNAHNDFLEAARQSVDTVGVAADDVGTGALPCGQPLNQRIYGLASTSKAQRAIEELERRGSRIFGD
jgi:hypothetical protein